MNVSWLYKRKIPTPLLIAAWLEHTQIALNILSYSCENRLALGITLAHIINEEYATDPQEFTKL
jgi:hypothetical protein